MSVKIFCQLVPRTFRNERKFQIFIQESFFDGLPRGIKTAIYKPYLKEILMEKYGPSAFLIPETRMFPIVNINTGQVDSRLIQYALIRGLTLRRISHDFDYIYKAALDCFEKHNCRESIFITLMETGEKVSLVSFLRNLDKLDGKFEIILPDDVDEDDSQKNQGKKKKHWHHNHKYKRLDKTAPPRKREY